MKKDMNANELCNSFQENGNLQKIVPDGNEREKAKAQGYVNAGYLALVAISGNVAAIGHRH